MESNETRDIAVMALTRIESHEKICAARWATTIKLLWSTVGGIALLFLSKFVDYVAMIEHVAK